jgi:hypothetical protein
MWVRITDQDAACLSLWLGFATLLSAPPLFSEYCPLEWKIAAALFATPPVMFIIWLIFQIVRNVVVSIRFRPEMEIGAPKDSAVIFDAEGGFRFGERK